MQQAWTLSSSAALFIYNYMSTRTPDLHAKVFESN